MNKSIVIRPLRLAFLMVFAVLSHVVCDAADAGRFVLVLDPGHGGKDYGCVGKLTNEKTIVLDVARRFGKMVGDSLPEIKTVFTRDDDRYLTLQNRADIANRAGGDVFVSIHVNSLDKRNRNRASIHGASVYTLGLHRSDSNLGVAMRENSVMELEDDYSETYQGFDPNSSESYIIFELNQNQHINHSLTLAEKMQRHLVSDAGRADKEVRQAGFWVLWATSMPSVLVELDFICNPEAERFLNSEQGRQSCAEALYNAFSEYYSQYKDGDYGPNSIVTKGLTPVEEKRSEASERQSKATDGGVKYSVQVLAVKHALKKNAPDLRGLEKTAYYREGKYYNYYCGQFDSHEKAKKYLAKIKKRYPKAFIIKTRNGKRIK